MKNLYLISMLVFCSFFTNAQNVVFGSAYFKAALISLTCADTNDDGILDNDVDTNNDGEIQVNEALAVTRLDVSNLGFQNIIGINAFTNLKTFNCTDNGISNFSISGLHNLISINCSGNYLYSITLNGLDQLETLECSGNGILTILNVSGSANLKNLNCSYNRLVNLDVTSFPALDKLNCANNILVSITAGASNVITELDCSYNPELILNYSVVPNLKVLNCSYNASTAIDVNALAQLERLNCNHNNLTVLTLSLPSLKILDCSSNVLTALDFTNLQSLESLTCYSNNITSLAVGNLNNLKTLICYRNNLATLNINTSSQLETVQCGYNSLTVLDASNLANLKELDCEHNLLTSLSLANPGQLKTLDCNTNALAVLNLSGVAGLETLNCSKNDLSELDTSALNSLKSLTCNNNHIPSLNLTNVTALETLICSHNELSDLNITPLANLKLISCGYNHLSAMNFDNLTKLRTIDLSANLFTTLDFSQMGGTTDYYEYTFDGNPNLTYINIKNGAHIRHTSGIHDSSRFWTNGCDNLRFVCADDFNLSRIYVAGAQVSSYCSFTPGGTYNTIVGKCTFDYDNNGCDENDDRFSYGKISIDDGIQTGATFTNDSGDYSFYTQTGSFTITPTYEHPYFAFSPTSAVVDFATLDGSAQTQNFCVVPVGVHNDLAVTILPAFGLRPGFDVLYHIAYENKGNQILSGDINLTFDGAIFNLISSNPAVGSQSLNTVNWTYANLLPFETRGIAVLFHLNSPQDTPPVNIGDVVTFNVAGNPVSGDETPDDNSYMLAQTVRGSNDPNDKLCLEGALIAPEKVGDYLNYMIRFQNSGTAAAENVIVNDVIDTDKYDVDSLQLVASSHPHRTKITGSKVEFIFEGINLPAQTDDENASHGFVAFKIKTKKTLAAGDSVSNTADIYFDYNFPVTTNTATTTIESLLAKNDFEDKSVSIFPNPVKDKLNITAKQNITSIQLYDAQGRLIETNVPNTADAVFNIGKNARGVYFVKVYTEKGVKVEKVIKE